MKLCQRTNKTESPTKPRHYADWVALKWKKTLAMLDIVLTGSFCSAKRNSANSAPHFELNSGNRSSQHQIHQIHQPWSTQRERLLVPDRQPSWLWNTWDWPKWDQEIPRKFMWCQASRCAYRCRTCFWTFQRCQKGRNWQDCSPGFTPSLGNLKENTCWFTVL